MTTVKAHVAVPGPPEAAQALWLDLARWPNMVDGFGRVDRVDGDWPQDGRVVWTSGPAGRGRVVERIVSFEPGVEHCVDVEDEQLRGRQTLRFAALDDGAVRVDAELEYKLKNGNPLLKLADLLFIRRQQRDALRRQLARLAVERQDDVTPGG